MENFSRREFLKNLIPGVGQLNETLNTDSESTETEKIELSRRDFLKFLGVLGAGAAMEHVGIKTASAEPAEPEIQIVSEIENNSIESYSETAIEQSLWIAAKVLTNHIFEELKINTGNASLSDEEIKRWVEKTPILPLFTSTMLGPLVEEFAWRALPSSMIDKNDNRINWNVGIPISAIFALSHNLKLKKELPGIEILGDSIPVTQFMGGLFYWYLMREKGYSHAVMAHSMSNTIPLAIATYLYKAYPEGSGERTFANKLVGIKNKKDIIEEAV